MSDAKIDSVYQSSSDPADQRALYDEWGNSYDDDMADQQYATPGRIAAALAAASDGVGTAVLDFGCGTGLSGEALAEAGFTTIDGTDLSQPMLDEAEDKGVYRKLWQLTAGQLDISPADYGAIIACGVVSPGAAPAETLQVMADKVAPGGLLVFSYNDHAMKADEYLDQLKTLTDGDFTEVSSEYGDHLPSHGTKSTVYVLRRAV